MNTKLNTAANTTVNRRRIDAEKAAVKLRERNNIDRQQAALRRQKEFTEKTHIWNEQILPRWEELANSSKVRELCAKGIPPNIRGKVWPLLIGNELQVDERLFEDLNRKVLMIYGNKVAANMRRSGDDGEETDDEKRMHKDATYKVFRDSFSSDEGQAAARSEHHSSQRQDVAERATSRDIPIPLLHQRATTHSVLGGEDKHLLLHPGLGKDSLPPLGHHDRPVSVAAAASHRHRLDITEESWFENERNGSLDSETFELIQRQLFKHSANNPRGPHQGDSDGDGGAYEEDDDGEGEAEDAGGLANKDCQAENVISTGSSPQFSASHTQQHCVRHAGIAAISGSGASVDSHFSLDSFSLIGSYVDRKHREVATAAHKGIPDNALVARHAHATASPHKGSSLLQKAMLNCASEALVAESVSQLGTSPSRLGLDLDDMSFELAGGTAVNSVSGSQPQSPPSTPATPTKIDQDGEQRRYQFFQDTMASRDANDTYQEECLRSPLTPPPRRRHSDEYLVEVGLLPASVQGPAAAEEEGAPPATPLKTIAPFPMTPADSGHSSVLASVCGRPPMPPYSRGGGSRVGSPLTENSKHRRSESMRVDAGPGGDAATGERSVADESGDMRVVRISKDSQGLNACEDGDKQQQQPRRRTSVPGVSALTAQLRMDHDREEAASRATAEAAACAITTRQSSEGEGMSGLKKSPRTKSTRSNERLLTGGSNTKLLNTMCLIEWDLPRTFPTLGFFHDGGPMHTGLERILLCYAVFRPEIGYVQGMSFLVATLLLYMDEFEAFKCLANLLGRRVNMDFYRLKKEAIDSYVLCFDHFFKKLLPLLYSHMRDEGVTSEMFLMDWNMALFTKALPLEVAAQVWDMYLLEGELYIMCVGLGILKMYAPKLSTLGVEKISPFLLHLPERISPEELFLNVSQIQISQKSYDRVRKKTAETARANALRLEHAKMVAAGAGGTMRRNRSGGNLPQWGGGTEADGGLEGTRTSHLGSTIKRALLDARDNLIGSGPSSSSSNSAGGVSAGGLSPVSDQPVSPPTQSRGGSDGPARRGSAAATAGSQKKSGLGECLQS